jgi:Cys-tRNA(Pro) deacylase
MPPDSPAIRELQRKGITFRIFEHAGTVISLEQAAHEREQSPQQVVRSILFRLSAGEYLLVLMPGPRQISWPTLRRALDQNRLSLASDEELLAVTGYVRGTVNPFGCPKPLRVLGDRSLLSLPEISLGSGVRGVAILITPTELVRALPELEIVDL